MVNETSLSALNETQLRELARGLMSQLENRDTLIARQNDELHWRQSKIDKLTHELAAHKRWRFGVRTERLTAEQLPAVSAT